MARYGFTLGLVPVQGWIADSRRSWDLKAGSAFLSWLMAKVLAKLTQDERLETTIHLPHTPSGTSFETLAEQPFSEVLQAPYGIPNRASGTLEAPEAETIRQTLASLQTLVDQAFQLWKDEFLAADQFPKDLELTLVPHLDTYQERTSGGADCPISVVWAAVPLEGDSTLGDLLGHLDRLYLDVKRTRPVRPWLWGASVGKCNQCGKREAIGPQPAEGTTERSGAFRAWRDWYDDLGLDSWVEQGFRIDRGERLCPICLTRRNAGYARGSQHPRAAFPSTGEIAAAPWLAAIERAVNEDGQPEEPGPARFRRETLRKALEAVRTTRAAKSDLGRALLTSEETLRRDLEDDAQELIARRRALDQAIRAWNETRPRGEQPLALSPSHYLALLVFDGDDMGRHVREEPHEVPARMHTFAEQVRAILDGAGAAVFYLAGDEGLAMVPAAVGLGTAQQIRDAFRNVFGGSAEAPTLSAALSFFEYSRPLGGAIGAAHESLSMAKARTGKDALAASVETASGNRWTLRRPWGPAWDRVSAVIDLIRSGALSTGWPYDAERFVRSLPEEAWARPESADAGREELRRLFFRSVPAREVRPEERFAHREDRWNASGGPGWLTDLDPESAGTVAELFHLVSFLARQVTDSPPGEEGEAA